MPQREQGEHYSSSCFDQIPDETQLKEKDFFFFFGSWFVKGCCDGGERSQLEREMREVAGNTVSTVWVQKDGRQKENLSYEPPGPAPQ